MSRAAALPPAAALRGAASECTQLPALSCIVSHDRCFLDDVTTDVLHVSGVARRLTQTRGNYTTWAQRRADQRKTLERTSAVRAMEIDKLKEYAGHGFKYESGRASDPGRLAYTHTAPRCSHLRRLPSAQVRRQRRH